MNIDNAHNLNSQKVEELARGDLERLQATTQRYFSSEFEDVDLAVLKALRVSGTYEADRFRVASVVERFSRTCLVTLPDFCQGEDNYKHISIVTNGKNYDIIFSTSYSEFHLKPMIMIFTLEPVEPTKTGGALARLDVTAHPPKLILYGESEQYGETDTDAALLRLESSGLLEDCLRHYAAR